MNIAGYIKEHPYASATILIVGGLVFYVIAFGGGNSQSVQYVETGPSDAEIAAQTNLGIAQINANAATMQANAAVKAAEIGAGVQLKSSEMEAAAAMEALRSNESINLANILSQKEIALATASSSIAASNIAANAQLEATRLAAAATTSEILANKEINLASIGAQREIALTGANSNLQIAQINSQAQLGAAGIAAGVTRDQIASAERLGLAANDRDIITATLAARTASEASAAARDIEMARIEGDNNLYALMTESNKFVAGLSAATNNALIASNIERDKIAAGVSIAQTNASAATMQYYIGSNAAVELAGLAKETAIGTQMLNVQNNSITAQRDVELAAIEASKSVGIAQATSAAQIQQINANYALAVTPSLKKKNRDDVAQALLTGEPYYPAVKPSNISEIAGGVATIGNTIANVVPFL